MSEDQRRCPHCGRVQMFDDKICPYCGQSMDGRIRRETVSDKARKQRKALKAGRDPKGDPEGWAQAENTGRMVKYIVRGIVLMVLALQILIVLDARGVLDRFRKPEEDAPVLQVTTEATEHPETAETTEVIETAAATETTAVTEAAAATEVTEAAAATEATEATDTTEAAETVEITEVPATEETEAEDREPEYLPFSWEEEESLQPDAMWKERERWEQAYPDVMGLELIAMEQTTELIDDNSRESLIQLLKEKLIPRKAAERIIDRFEIDFNIQCYKCMRSYLSHSSFSPKDMEDQLDYEGFTPEEIRYAMGREEVDWYDQLGFWVYDELKERGYSESGLLEKLKEEGFDPKDIEKWHETAEIDYNELAVKKAQALDKIYLGFNYYMLMELLQQEGFTEQQAEYAAQVLDLK